LIFFKKTKKVGKDLGKIKKKKKKKKAACLEAWHGVLLETISSFFLVKREQPDTYEIDYYGILVDIVEVEYKGQPNINLVVFKIQA